MIGLLLLAAGCTFAPGAGFGELHSVGLDAALVPGAARDLGGGAVLTDLVYEVTPTVLTLELGAVELLELSGGGSATFDPANPPEGYGLCHGGHCHRDDGALVDYADVEAELAGDNASFVAVASLPVDTEVDLLAGATLDLTPADGLLPGADISKLTLGVGRFVLQASVTDGVDSWPLSADLALDGTLGVGLDLPVDRDHDPIVDLQLALEPGGTLFDTLDFATLADAEGAVVLTDPDAVASLTLSAAILAVEPLPTLTRHPQSE